MRSDTYARRHGGDGKDERGQLETALSQWRRPCPMTMGRHVHSYTLYRYGVKSGCAAGRRRCGRACRVGQATVGDAGGTGAGGEDDLLRPAPFLPGRGHAGPITSRRRPMRPRGRPRPRRGSSRDAIVPAGEIGSDRPLVGDQPLVAHRPFALRCRARAACQRAAQSTAGAPHGAPRARCARAFPQMARIWGSERRGESVHAGMRKGPGQFTLPGPSIGLCCVWCATVAAVSRGARGDDDRAARPRGGAGR